MENGLAPLMSGNAVADLLSPGFRRQQIARIVNGIEEQIDKANAEITLSLCYRNASNDSRTVQR